MIARSVPTSSSCPTLTRSPCCQLHEAFRRFQYLTSPEAIYPEDVIAHHRAFIARRRAERPSEEYRDLTNHEWDEFLGHFELRKVALGTCGRDHGTPCQHENACVRCPLLRVDPAQLSRLEEIHANLADQLQEAKEQGWMGEVAAIETTMAAAAQKLEAMRSARNTPVHLGMPDIRLSAGRSEA